MNSAILRLTFVSFFERELFDKGENSLSRTSFHDIDIQSLVFVAKMPRFTLRYSREREGRLTAVKIINEPSCAGLATKTHITVIHLVILTRTLLRGR